MWPLLTGANTTQPRPLTPVTEVSIVDTSDSAHCERQTTRAHLLAPSLIVILARHEFNARRLIRWFAVCGGRVEAHHAGRPERLLHPELHSGALHSCLRPLTLTKRLSSPCCVYSHAGAVVPQLPGNSLADTACLAARQPDPKQPGSSLGLHQPPVMLSPSNVTLPPVILSV